jgi:hypothetical protein
MPEDETAANDELGTRSERYRQLPQPVRLEDTIATQPAKPPAEPAVGDSTDDALRAGG